jgi:RNA polymerase sigma-70 factor, ECF subfamily
MLRRLAGDLADDLAQDAFVIAWRAIGQWRQEGSFRAWLLRIAWRQFLSHRRSHRATETLDSLQETGIAACADKRAEIAQALGRLGERELMGALLCFAEGYSHGEAAKILDVPLGTLKSLVARARRELVACLKDER